MIIIDFSQLCISNLMVHLEIGETLNEEELRIMILNSLRKNISAFKKEYGKNVIIACDSGQSWRKAVFTYYKANRKKARENSVIDWETVFKYINNIKAELKEYTPYKVIEFPQAEADDVISYFVHKNGVVFIEGEPIVIISGDKDFAQLQKFDNVAQYDPVNKRKIVQNNPRDFLIEHIIRGDKSDGVPNCLSDDDTFVVGKRQVTLTKKRFQALFAAAKDGTITEPGYFRNKMLIDLENTPASLDEGIEKVYLAESNKGRKMFSTYFTKYGLHTLLESIGDF